MVNYATSWRWRNGDKVGISRSWREGFTTEHTKQAQRTQRSFFEIFGSSLRPLW